jgi:hypothetical protein
MEMRLTNFLSLTASFLMIYSMTGCTSPYSARGIPEVQGLEAKYIDADTAEITISQDFPKDCEYRRNAILLKSAYIALSYDYDHFEFTTEEEASKLGYNPINLNSDQPIKVYLCRGTCPVMYSASSMSHILVTKFSRPTWQTPPTRHQEEKCLLKSNR